MTLDLVVMAEAAYHAGKTTDPDAQKHGMRC